MAEAKTAMVDVELVIDRENHQDKLYGTDVVWLHKGDIKKVPEALWPKFAIHHDVYRLANPVKAAEKDRQEVLAKAAEATKKLDDTLAASRAEIKLPAAVTAPLFVTPDQLEGIPDDKIREEGAKRGYKLHPNLSSANLRAKFIAAQDADTEVKKPEPAPA